MPKYGKESRIQRALERQNSREKRSNKDQLAILDKRLGVGIGAKKERERLANTKTIKKEESKKEDIKATKKSKKVKAKA